MTAIPRNPRVSELRELFRNYLAFHAAFEETGLEVITSPSGAEWSIWDLDYLRSQFSRLTVPQQQAITLCLIHNLREKDAAVAMGVSLTNPVSMYASLGLQRLLDMIDAGELQRFREQRMHPSERHDRHESSLKAIIAHIENQITLDDNQCWIFPGHETKTPKMLVRSPRSASGFLSVSPVELLFRHYVGPFPVGSSWQHKSDPAAPACVNPHHGQLTLPSHYRARLQVLARRHSAERTSS